MISLFKYLIRNSSIGISVYKIEVMHSLSEIKEEKNSGKLDTVTI